MIISFAYTTPALLAGAKTVTRRFWDPDHAARFKRGDLVDAYGKSPRFGGKKVAVIRLTCDPYLEPMFLMPMSDYEAEGFKYLCEHPTLISATGRAEFGNFSWGRFERWRISGGSAWVVRFELVEVIE